MYFEMNNTGGYSFFINYYLLILQLNYNLILGFSLVYK